MNCEFREATENDFEGIRQLIKTEEELFKVYPNGKYPFTVEQVSRLYQTRKALTVAVEGNEIIGFANLYDYKPKHFAFIGNVVIEKSHRGRGLGKAIISYMLKMAHEKYDLAEVRISVFSDNTVALLLYSRFGFVPYAMEERKNPAGYRIALIHMRIAIKS
jgi:ribosomal protein S18 acetylase RimI-like enzyme